MMRLAGLDGCKAGWLSVRMPPGRPEAAEARIVARAAEALAFADLVAIDIPIGLMNAPADGPRPADAAARAFLSAHNTGGVRGVGSRVFPAPTRAHLAILRAGGDYQDLLGRFRKGEHISKQCFMICPKITELDDLLHDAPEAPLWEAHPEIAFARLAGRTLPPKRSPAGAEARRALLAREGFDIGRLGAGVSEPRSAWAMDDLLDACALALTAARIHAGTHAALPDPPERDARGRRMAIHY